MTVKVFAIDAANTWLHAYEVNPANVNGMPIGGELYGVDGVRYVVNGGTLQQSAPPLTTEELDERLLEALGNIEQSLGLRLDRQAVGDTERKERLRQATDLVAAIRAKSSPAERFAVMKPAFTHTGPVGGFNPGSWLHNLFCH